MMHLIRQAHRLRELGRSLRRVGTGLGWWALTRARIFAMSDLLRDRL